MEYYALILVSVVMFGGCFALNDAFRQRCGGTLRVSLYYTFFSTLAGLFVLLAVNSFRFEFTPFTLLMAALASANGIGFSFCSFKALSKINLSLYSLFSMLGGMLLPFVFGILCYGEGMTVAKGVCIVVLTAALAVTVEKSDKKKNSGWIYYIGIFTLNGMSGVLTQIFTKAPYAKTSAAGYSILSATVTVLLTGCISLFFAIRQGRLRISKSAYLIGAASGITSRVANYFLVIALAFVHGSVQYPMVTGGTIIVSTAICFFGKSKPSRRELISVALAFLGVLALVLIPV